MCHSAQDHFRNLEAENKAGKFVFPEQMGRFGVPVETALTAGSGSWDTKGFNMFHSRLFSLGAEDSFISVQR